MNYYEYDYIISLKCMDSEFRPPLLCASNILPGIRIADELNFGAELSGMPYKFQEISSRTKICIYLCEINAYMYSDIKIKSCNMKLGSKVILRVLEEGMYCNFIQFYILFLLLLIYGLISLWNHALRLVFM